jgi:hypothetical protein
VLDSSFLRFGKDSDTINIYKLCHCNTDEVTARALHTLSSPIFSVLSPVVFVFVSFGPAKITVILLQSLAQRLSDLFYYYFFRSGEFARETLSVQKQRTDSSVKLHRATLTSKQIPPLRI